MKTQLIIFLWVATSFFLCGHAHGQVDLFVAAQGNDNNRGTKEKPFATLQKAKAVARETAGKVTVYVREGTYYLNEPLVFTLLDSREDGEEMVFKAYGHERVTISGAKVLLPKWHVLKNGLHMASIPDDPVFDQLFVDGRQQPMARYPNFNPLRRHYNGTSADAISKTRTERWKDPSGAYLHALHGSEWGDFHFLITGKDSTGKLLLEGGFQNNRRTGMHTQYRFVENVREELDTLGEWYYSKQDRKLYYLAANNLRGAKIESPQLRQLFEFRGSQASPVRNITLEGLTLVHTLRTFMETKEPLLRSDWTIYRGGAVLMEGAEQCIIKNCTFDAIGGNAVFFSNYNRDNQVVGCEIVNIGASGVCFVGDPGAVRSPSFEYNQFVPLNAMDIVPGPKTGNYPARCLVYDNLIHDVGLVEKQVAGVQISMAQDITVSHNTIYNMPRAGINVSEGTWGGHIFEYNDVFNTVLETGDHGSFNSWGRDRYWHPNYDSMKSRVMALPGLPLLDVVNPIVIRNNRFRCDHGWDIDLDDGSSNYHIYNNVCLNGGLKLREGFYRVVENNIIINNSFHPHVWFANSHDIFRHNIVTRHYFPIRVSNWGDQVDYNLFPDSLALAQARSGGTDLHSKAAMPDFVNPIEGDYAVAENSAAYAIGFRNFAMDSFGVLSPSLKARALKVQLPVILDNTESREHRYAWMGMSIKNLTTLGERSATGMATEAGVYVLEVETWSFWSKYLRPNDVILALGDTTIKTVEDLERSFGALSSGEVAMTVFRSQAALKLIVRR
ncbi:PDZ domain-containing protein [Chryseolinea lacunae]|uniref:Peptide-binding protein n=1 Tax=Chryseolinea lacunae TaxID=2801331 RepID=A0ABS1L207_9BACT|nr:PDZ domain-containing protein [Chryseolinea lacunae]MBL0745756.1 peptide-binding protein [Chryseolinea lacunae]